MGLTQLIEGLNRTKRLTLPQVRVNSPCLPSNCDTSFFPPSDSSRSMGSSWVLSLLAFRLELHHQLSWVSSLLTTDLRTCQPPSSHEPVPYNNSPSLCIHPVGSISLENPDSSGVQWLRPGRKVRFAQKSTIWGVGNKHMVLVLLLSQCPAPALTCLFASVFWGNTPHILQTVVLGPLADRI